uniref:Uncharacterized protein LOC111105350 n=1 Tax=Crassostrea virginica TaxID=6565 RepID=A0A8B8AX50_CRAVI|nr:uncharacterized protein LOC111105350 [Crassostrea virginica]
MSLPESIVDKLADVKSQLSDLRRQDIDLMRQLIQISESIQKLNKSKFPPDNHVISRTFVTKVNGKKGYVGVNIVPPEALTEPEAPLLRRQSAPNITPYHLKSASISSMEDFCASDEEYGTPVDSVSDPNQLSVKSNFLLSHRPYLSARRFSDIVTKFPIVHRSSDTEYEKILMRNIKLWKEGQLDSDSVFV